MTRLLLPILLASTATAHFSLSVPKPIGDSDEKQGTAPCGGYTASSSSATTDFHVSGDAVGMENGHPQTNWLFRATLDQTAGGNWTQVFPIVMQTGLGNFCEPQIAVPAEYAGKKGVIGVVAHSPDGLLYSCAAVNFVTGAAPTRSECKNASITVDYYSDPSLEALVKAGAGSSSSAPASSSSPSGSAAASSTPNAAPGMTSGLLTVGTMGSVLVSLAAAVGGAALFF
ncbi:gpi anchored protein [Colletotrichum truncatum]|uniref:Gpi anchored protein n=1 Tax=Colletotrichum truncatum TaxID=5467 RepID=A0ACC3YK85_COLTU|nr:gpi anchored protein [Colletotrichum truncatum]KAF6784396.1 gpi anchored protein [Colletotrichum truncatum]